jgi:WD40 repeat protein/serine/threonine protein kinase
MNSDRDQLVKEIFADALEKADAAERAAYLSQACGADAQLRQHVEALLQAHQKAGAFLEEPAPPPPGIKIVLAKLLTEKPGDRIGHYKLLEQIGEGGCGVVYMAEQEEPIRRRVAFKVIKLGMDTKQVIARFEAERQALALMDHPNIAKVLDAGATDAGRPYFVMELVRGIRITDYCDQNNLSTEERLKLFVQICHAIQHVHQKGIIHRDIKPSNILVTLHDGVPVPKVIDFGIAKATGQRLTDKTLFTAFQQFVGTPAYMSPEQAEMSGLDVDTRSDIYALGVLLYELLTGQTPFEQKALVAAGLDEMRRIIREQEPVRPSTRLSTLADPERTTVAKRRGAGPPQLIHLLRGDLDWIVMKALEKDRTLRYDTANGLALDVERFQNHEPVVARPHSTVYRVRKFVRRNRVMVAAAATVGVVLVLGIFGSTWQAIRATKAEREQSRLRQQAEADRGKAQTAQASEAQQRRRAEAQAYVGNMRLLQEAAEENDAVQCRDLLQETASNPARGFEWYYWQRQIHLDLRTFHGHSGGVLSVAFSPDGQRIVTGSLDGTAKVWETASGKELVTFKGHRAGINSVAFAPDGQRIVTSGLNDPTPRVWDSTSAKELLSLKGHHAMVNSVAFSPDGQRIATASSDGTVKVWNAARGNELLVLTGHLYSVLSVGFSPDGRRIATGGEDHTARVWEADSGVQLLVLTGHLYEVFSVAFSPDGQRIVTGGPDARAKVWEAASGKELRTLRARNEINSVAFSPDGRRIATGSGYSSYLAVQVWDADSGEELLAFNGHNDQVRSVAFSQDGQRLVTGSLDGTAKLWDLGRREKLLTHSGKSVSSVAFSPDGQRIATGGEDGTVKVWGTASGQDLLNFKAHSLMIRLVAFSPDGQRMVTSGQRDPTAKVWDAASGRELFTLTGHSNEIFSAAFSPDGRQIATGSLDQTAKVWEANTGKELLTFRGHVTMVNCVAFSPDGQRIVSGGDDVTRVWEAASGKELLSPLGQSQAVAFSPDGRRIVTGDPHRTVKVWDAANGKELLSFKGHSGIIWSVAFSPDGQRVVTGSDDKTAKVWDAASGKELLTFKRQNAEGAFAVFSPDGQRIVTGGVGGAAKVREAATVQEVAAWQAEEKADLDRMATLRREREAAAERERALRAHDPGAVKQWLVLAPIPFQDQTSGGAMKALDQEQVSPESGLRPRASDRVKVGAGELVWNAPRQEDYLLDFNQLLGKQTEWSVAYAVCYIQSDAAQAGVVMKVGSDDQAKIYINGKEIYRNEIGRACVPDQDEVAGIELRAELNVLVFKVVNGINDWQGSVRFTDAAGQPPKGIRVTLDPDGKD